MAKEKVEYYGTGRRKSSIARVRLLPGSGKITINHREFTEYIPSPAVRLDVLQPLSITNTSSSYDAFVNVKGGGISGQAGAIRHGITRALLNVNSDFRPVLKKAGMITRDPRAKERKKYGLRGARRAPQFSKR